MRARIGWQVLAVVDAVLLLWLAASFGWRPGPPPAAATPAAFIVFGIFAAMVAARTVFAAAFFVAVGAAIVGESRPSTTRLRLVARVAAGVLALALVAVVALWGVEWRELAAVDRLAIDRLDLFERLASAHGTDATNVLGLAPYQRGSTGAYLVVLLAFAYLAEKYLVTSSGRRWPVPAAPIAMVVSLAWLAYSGERIQRAHVASQEWHLAGDAQTWQEALDSCGRLGAGWRLPRRSELALLLSRSPERVRGWQGAAWTSTIAERGTRAVTVDLSPRRSGAWRRNDDMWRDASPCEADLRRQVVDDAFTRQRERVCRSAASPLLHTSAAVLLVVRRGVKWDLSRAATICVRPSPEDLRLPVRGRGYPDELDVGSFEEFRVALAAFCDARAGRRPFACFAFAGDAPPFEETGTERLYRLACQDELNGYGCFGYAHEMDRRGETERARRYRDLACERGYAAACGNSPELQYPRVLRSLS